MSFFVEFEKFNFSLKLLIFENSDSSFGNTSSQNGSKNILLDALLRKFNVSMDLDTNSDNLSSSKTVPLQKQLTRYLGDDKKKKQSDLQRKINRSNFEKQTLATHLKEISMETEDKVEASSSFDDDPKQIKVIKNTSTQISLGLNKRSSNSQLICVTKLPQHFECKYNTEKRVYKKLKLDVSAYYFSKYSSI